MAELHKTASYDHASWKNDEAPLSAANNTMNTASSTNEAGPFNITIPSIALPKGGGAIKGIDEQFEVNAINGSTNFSIPLPVGTARGFAPALAISYNSGSGNGVFGLGWNLSLPAIRRKTDKQLPQYADDGDTFVFSGGEDLVPKLILQDDEWIAAEQDSTNGQFIIKQYRPRIENVFARIERWKNKADGIIHWRVIAKDNSTSILGDTPTCRIADPLDPNKIFEWLLHFSYDDKGNVILYEYKQEDAAGINPLLVHNKNRSNGNAAFTNTLLKRVRCGNISPYSIDAPVPAASQFVFETVLDYGEHDAANAPFNEIQPWPFRVDAFSDYRAGFEIRTCRLCKRVLLFHHFAELPGGSACVRSLDLSYDNNGQTGNFTFLKEVSSTGYIKQTNGNYTKSALPPITFSYQQHEWNTTINTPPAGSMMHAPSGIYEPDYQWVDLFNEGLSGILSQQGAGLFYKHNLGEGNFSNAKLISPHPSFAGMGNALQLQELEADGTKYFTGFTGVNKGFFKINDDDEWQPFQSFKQLPTIDFNDPHTRLLDLNGDGKAELLITGDNVFTWYPSLGEKGYDTCHKVWQQVDDEKGPHMVFNDLEQSIFLADMNGDGLTDIVRIQNGSVCYWPNLGYGKFGAKVTMDNAPFFDQPDLFNASFIKLADIDGSGTTDIIYLGNQQCTIWLNQHGNSFLPEPQRIDPFPEATPLSQIAVLDFLGNGTSCLVWSTTQPKDREQPLRYIDLMNSKKPHLLVSYKNNLGKEVELEYKASTYYYLQDQLQGTPWVTKLPFPVHCLSKLITRDRILKTRFASEFSYHHGYYDHAEREFRGFGRVEQTDAEDTVHFIKESADALNGVIEQDLHQPPVLIKTWFHTGAFIDNEKILTQFAHEYAQNDLHPENKLPEPVLPAALSIDEYRQALRACKGRLLRKEVYALDNTELQPLPYIVEQQNCRLTLLQPQLSNQHACFIVADSESMSYQYERNINDPRVTHSFVLETDAFANVTKSASMVYPRKPQTGIPVLPAEQVTRYATYRENDFTNAINTADAYRSPVLYQTKSFELNGLPVPADDYYSLQEIKDHCATAAAIDYEVVPNGAKQKRLVDYSRLQFRGNDGAAILSFGTIESKCLHHRSFKAAFTPNLLSTIFAAHITPADLHTLLTDATKGGYTFADNFYWVPSATPQYDIAQFCLPFAYTDAFNSTTQIEYDTTYHLFPKKTTDALGNVIQVNNFNYRVIQPYVMQDVNDNIAGVRFDELGFVTGTFLIGKKGIDAGDEMDDTNVEASANDFPAATIAYHASEWYNQTKQPGFDINNYKPKPNFFTITTRETHYHANPAHTTKLQTSYTYFGGSGQEVLKKVQAEPGEALQVDLDGTVTTVDTSPNVRWVGNGRIILNNKGNAVKQYEPYFSVTPGYDDEKEMAELGVTAILHYDPLSRVIQTDYPNKTFSKVEFSPWLQKTFDANDTVAQSDWYKFRITTPDPAIATPEEISAAQKAFLHNNTPSLAHLDTLGRVFLTEANTGTEQLTTRIQFDIEGKEIQVTDALNRTIMQYKYDLLSRCIKKINLDAGVRFTLADVANNECIRWDDRAHEFRSLYDALRRPVLSTVQTGNVAPITYSKTEYGESLAPAMAKANNLRGIAYKNFDQSGINTIIKNDFKGNQISGSQQLTANYKTTIDWTNTAAVQLEADLFTVNTEYDGLNRALTIITPHTPAMTPSEVLPGYNEAGLLDKIEIRIRGAVAATPFVTNINYNAKGKRESIFYGNNTKTKYTYDKDNFRLTQLLTTRNNGNILQDLKYTYDPVGNLTRIKDNAQPDVFFDNEQAQALNSYEYDAIYRLISATGRKHAGQTDIQSKANMGSNTSFRNHPFVNSGSINPNEANAFRNYTESFVYDKAGNMKQQQHVSKNSSWTRTFEYDNNNNTNNRLTKTSINGDDYNYTYDAHGNMLDLETVSNEVWDFNDQFKQASLTGGGTVYYVYDGHGERVRKVVERSNGIVQERIYLGGIEIYREKNNAGTLTLERETLHVMDEQKRIAMIDTPVVKPAGSNETELVRHQYNNHLGSSSIELDEAAQVISYEEYFPYGTTSFTTIDSTREVAPKRYRYTAKERDDESGLNYHGARYYTPWLCRWTAIEPLLITATKTPIGKLAYGYCSNNPVNRIDPDGKRDYYNTEGEFVGNDGNRADKNLTILLNSADVEKVEDNYKGSRTRRFFNATFYPALGALTGALAVGIGSNSWDGALLGAGIGALVGLVVRLAFHKEIFYSKSSTALSELSGKSVDIPVTVRRAVGEGVDQSNKPTGDRRPPVDKDPTHPFRPDPDGKFHEEGGRWGVNAAGETVVLPANPGSVSVPVDGIDALAQVDVADTIAGVSTDNITIKGRYHIHPYGDGLKPEAPAQTTQTGTSLSGGGPTIKWFEQPPSAPDRQKASEQPLELSIVVGVASRTVYFYDGSNTTKNPYFAKIPLKKFLEGTK
jgi:RHS repeat-associated protein